MPEIIQPIIPENTSFSNDNYDDDESLRRKIKRNIAMKMTPPEMQNKVPVGAEKVDDLEPIKVKQYILVTCDFAGLGFAKQEIDRNDSPVIIAYKPKDGYEDKDMKDSYKKCAEGICETFELDKLLENRDEYKDWIWVWDGNHNVDENELLKSEGYKVIFGGEFCYQLENDREYGLKFAEECGLISPESFEFSSVDDGVRFLEEHAEENFVFKPNETDENWLTYVPVNEEPVNGNIELREFIMAIDKSFNLSNGFILQKKVQGVEVNVEAFCLNGEFIFAHANFENKKTGVNDSGSACGCAYDVDFKLDMNSELFRRTVGKFSDKLKEKGFTGFADANVIVGEFQEIYFLEFCFRTGYNMAINFFFNLSNKTYLEFCGDLADGVNKIQSRDGFGATLTVFSDHQHCGLPVYFPESLKNKFYPFDLYEEDDKYYQAGVPSNGHELAIVCAHDYSIELALKNVVENAEKVVVPGGYARFDAYKLKDTPRSPKRRLEALETMKML